MKSVTLIFARSVSADFCEELDTPNFITEVLTSQN